MKPALRELLVQSLWLVVLYLAIGSGMFANGADFPQPWCKVHCGDGSTGSGTLVDRNDRLGLVVTAYHVVRDVMPNGKQSASVVCEFENGHRAGATVVSYNATRDLCALIIQRPEVRPILLTAYTGQGTHTVYGFPGGGQLRRVSGRIVDDTRFLLGPGDYPVSVLSAASFPGQSGAGVITDTGMVGVMWGCDDDGHANMTCGKPFDEFMVSLTQCYSCQSGKCWQPSPQYSPGGHVIITSPTPAKPPVSQPVAASFTDPRWIEWRNKIDAQIAAIKSCNCDHSQQVTKADLESAIAKIQVKPGPQGPAGPAGPPGPPGEAGKPGESPALNSEQHIVIVADRNSSWWPRLSDDIEKTKDTYVGIRVAPVPPNYSGEIPTAVVYEDSVAVRVVPGERNVLELLSRVRRGMSI